MCWNQRTDFEASWFESAVLRTSYTVVLQVCNAAVGFSFLPLTQVLGVPLVYAGFGVVSLVAISFVHAFVPETTGIPLEELQNQQVRLSSTETVSTCSH